MFLSLICCLHRLATGEPSMCLSLASREGGRVALAGEIVSYCNLICTAAASFSPGEWREGEEVEGESCLHFKSASRNPIRGSLA